MLASYISSLNSLGGWAGNYIIATMYTMVSVTTPQECSQLRNMHARVRICLISSFVTHKESASQEALLIVYRDDQ